MVVYIYKINVKDKYYIGSTENIEQRIQIHKSRCYNINSTKYNYKVYKYIRENCNDWSEVTINILDVYDVISDEFKLEIEQYYMDYFSNNLNMVRAKRSIELDKVRCNKRRKIKYNNDEEYRNKMNERKREKVECECGIIVNRTNISTHRKSKRHQLLLNK
jgi:hypothetical protein